MDIVTLSIAKKYVKDSLKGLGAIQGKNCVIESIQKDEINHQSVVTFSWTADDGTKQTATMNVLDGINGLTDYEDLENKPKIDGVELIGNKTFENLGIASAIDLAQTDVHLQDLADLVGDKANLPMPNETMADNIEYVDTKVDGLIDDNATGLAKTFSSDKITKTFATLEEVNERIPQYEIMPTATESCGGQVVQFIGTTTSDYTHGYFYECVPQDNRYIWKNIGVQTIPVNLSELSNDSGYITVNVDNLVNYYLKTETYSQTEVDEIVGKLNRLTTEIVTELPTENISTTTIYLVKVDDTNNYTQHMYIGDAWADLGSTTIDLSGYVSTQKLITVLADYVKSTDLQAHIDNNTVHLTTEDRDNLTNLLLDEHNHANKAVIDKFTESSDGKPLYNGNGIGNDAIIDTEMSDTSTNAVQNKVMKQYVDTLQSSISTSQGRNLVPIPTANRTTNGVTYTVQSDGSVVANGTASVDNNAYYNFAYKTLKFDDASYTLSCKGLPKSVYVYVYDETIRKAVANVTDVPTTKTFIGNSTHIYSLSINVGKGTTVSDLGVKPILEMGTITHTYEPISESNVNLKKEIDKIPTVQGRNLIPYPYYNGVNYESNGITYTVNEIDGTITVNGTATKESDFRLISPYDASARKTLEFGQTYTLSDGVNQLNSSGYQAPVYFQFVRLDTTKNDFNYGISTNYGNMTWIANEANLLQYGIRIVVRAGITVDNVVLKPMLEIGAIAHSYEPTTEDNVSLKTMISNKADKSKVVDVDWTSVDISGIDENTNTEAILNYCIKNGICYMSVLNIGCKSANQTIILGDGSIPKPSSDYCWSPLIGVTDPSYSILVHPNVNGGLEHYTVGLTSQVYSGLFSYPVAES